MLEGRGDYKMKFTFKRLCHQNFNDIWEDTPEKRSLSHTILDLLLSPTYRLPRTVNAVRIYKDWNCFSVCPRCKKVIEYEYQSYCGSCGQCLDWSKLDDAEEEFIGWDGVEEDD